MVEAQKGWLIYMDEPFGLDKNSYEYYMELEPYSLK